MKLLKNEIVPVRITEVDVFKFVSARVGIDVFWETNTLTAFDIKQHIKNHVYEVTYEVYEVITKQTRR